MVSCARFSPFWVAGGAGLSRSACLHAGKERQTTRRTRIIPRGLASLNPTESGRGAVAPASGETQLLLLHARGDFLAQPVEIDRLDRPQRDLGATFDVFRSHQGVLEDHRAKAQSA